MKLPIDHGENDIKTSPPILLVIAFVSGFCVMAMEISASRLLAPFFGASIIVWTNIIGIVMIALSLGYYYGGRLADKKPELWFLLRFIFAAGALFLFVPVVVEPVSSFAFSIVDASQSAYITIFIPSLLAVVILYSAPLFLLGMVSPFIIKLISINHENRIGELSGKVFAVSTVGSILGTFLPTHYFLSIIGTKYSIILFATVLVLMGSPGFYKNKQGLLALLLIPMAFYLNPSRIINEPNIIAETESAYQYISIVQEDEHRHLLYNEGNSVQSEYHPTRMLTGSYYDYYNLLPYLYYSDKPVRVLIIGLAGGSIARQMNHFFCGKVQIDGVEIDQKVIDLAYKYFDLGSTKTSVFNQDGRMFLRSGKKQYDIIIVDAFQQDIYIPFTLTTIEFWKLVQGHLSPQGMLAMNVNSTSPDSQLLTVLVNTIASVFNHTYITLVDQESANYMVTASSRDFDLTGVRALIEDDELEHLADIFEKHTRKASYDAGKVVFTDDLAPVEFMTDVMDIKFTKNIMHNTGEAKEQFQ